MFNSKWLVGIALSSICAAQILNPTPTTSGPRFQRGGFMAGNPGAGGGGAISFTDVQHPFGTPATCTNCAVTLTQSIGTGNILVAMANGYTNAVIISGITGQSGLVHCPTGWNKGSSSTGFSDIAYVPSTTAQVSPVNVTFTGATGSTTNIQLQEISVTNGPASLDICGSISNPLNTTTQPGVTPTYSGAGANEFTMQYCSTAAACSSQTGYTSLNVNTNGQGWATQNNSKTTTPPSWTLSGAGIMEAGIIAFGKSTTPCQSTVVVDFGGGTNGVQFTNAALNNSTHQLHEITPWAVTGTVGFKADTASKTALVNSVRFCDDGSTYSDASTLGAKFDISTTDLLSYGFTILPDNISYSYYWSTTVPNNDNGNQYDWGSIRLSNGEKATLNILGNGTALTARLEISGGATIQNNCGTVTSGTRYLVTEEAVRNTRYTLKMYDATTPGSLSLVCTANGLTQSSNPITNIEIGHSGGVTAGSSLFFTYSQLKISFDATFPLLD